MESEKIIISEVYKPRYSEARQIIDMSNPKIRVNVWVEKLWTHGDNLYNEFEKVFKENPIFNEPQLLVLEGNKLDAETVDRILLSSRSCRLRHLNVLAMGHGLIFGSKSSVQDFTRNLKRLTMDCKGSNGLRGLVICGLAGLDTHPDLQCQDFIAINTAIRRTISREYHDTPYARMCDVRHIGRYIEEGPPTPVRQYDGSLLQKPIPETLAVNPQGLSIFARTIFESIKSVAFDMFVNPMVQNKFPSAAITNFCPGDDVLSEEAYFPAIGLDEVHQTLHQECWDYVGSSEPDLQNFTENQRLNLLALPSLQRLSSTAKYLPNGKLDEDEPWD